MIEAFESSCVQDKCFDRPFASFIEKDHLLHLCSGIMQKGSQQRRVPNPSLDSFLDKITLGTAT